MLTLLAIDICGNAYYGKHLLLPETRNSVPSAHVFRRFSNKLPDSRNSLKHGGIHAH